MSKWSTLLRLVAIGVTLGVVSAACGTESDDTDGTVLRVSSGLGSTNLAWTDGAVPWMDEVERLTDGAVRFESFTGGELVELRREAHALEAGVVDIAALLPTYQPDQFPLVEVAMLPLQESDTLIGSTAWKNLLESDEAVFEGQTFHEWQFASKGMKAIPLHTTPEYSVATTGGGFESVEAMRALQLRTASRVQNIASDLFGASAVSIPNAEAFDALSRGTIDGGYAAVADWANYGLQDLYQTTLTGLNFGHFPLVMAMTEETWNSFEASVQQAMQQAMASTYEDAARAWMDRMDDIRTYNEQEAGGEFVDVTTLPSAVQEVVVESTASTWDEWIEMMENSGMPGRVTAQQWLRAVEDAGGQVPADVIDRVEGD